MSYCFMPNFTRRYLFTSHQARAIRCSSSRTRGAWRVNCDRRCALGPSKDRNHARAGTEGRDQEQSDEDQRHARRQCQHLLAERRHFNMIGQRYGMVALSYHSTGNSRAGCCFGFGVIGRWVVGQRLNSI